jgi:hypothetical protein
MGLEPTSRDIKEGIVKSDNLKSASLAGKSVFYQLNYPPQDLGFSFCVVLRKDGNPRAKPLV